MALHDARRFEPHRPVELVKAAFRECFAQAGAAFVAAGVMLLPATALTLAFGYLLGRTGALERMMALQGTQVDPTQIDMAELMGDLLMLAGGGVGIGIVSVLSAFAAAAAVSRMVAERALGRPYTAAQAWDFVLGKLWRLTGGGIVAGAALVGAYVIASVPAGIVGVILLAATGGMQPGAKPSPLVQVASSIIVLPILAIAGAYLASMPSIVAVEDLGGISAVFRSFRLAAGRLRHVVATVVLGGLILVAPSSVVQTVMQLGLLEPLTKALGGGPGMLVAFAPGSLLGLVAAPIMYVLLALIYFDLRSRQTEEDFTPCELALEVGGALPEGVQDPFAASGLPAPDAASPESSDMS